jgi:hypothetical protein
MDRHKQSQARADRPGAEFLRQQATLALMAAAAAAPLLALAWLMPRMFVLPVASLLALAGASAVALFAWRCGVIRNSPRVTLWDVAGALALIGFAAGMLSEPDHVARLFATSDITK